MTPHQHNAFKQANEDKPLELKFSAKPNRLYTKHSPRQGFTAEFSSWI